ncbi:hypothetical protein [Pontibacter rugosus]|uniref:Uncharacterized protein n=1 Tax=Pontibacter rugosus TaxID=1745966 RepID=A0ABW3STE6_9BACT
MNRIKQNKMKSLWLLIPFALFACQEQPKEQPEIESTHPTLANDLVKDSLEAPYTDTTDSKLYDRYKISEEEYDIKK